jgi:hypothetical protein
MAAGAKRASGLDAWSVSKPPLRTLKMANPMDMLAMRYSAVNQQKRMGPVPRAICCIAFAVDERSGGGKVLISSCFRLYDPGFVRYRTEHALGG